MFRKASCHSHIALIRINENKFDAIIMRKILDQLNVRMLALALGVAGLVAGSTLAASHTDAPKTKAPPAVPRCTPIRFTMRTV